MARRKRKKIHNGYIFLLTLILTISLGSVIMVGSWAMSGMEFAQAEIDAVNEDYSAELPHSPEDNRTAAGSADASQVQEEEKAEPAGKYDALLADTETCREQNIYAKETASPEEVTIAFAGDILFADGYAIMAKMQQRAQGIAGSVSQEVLEVLHGADIFMVNNEFTYTDRGEPTPEKQFTFRAKPEYASYLLEMGADIVSLANNHAYDYGEVSLLDTMDTLDSLAMPYVGAGVNLEEAVKPVYFIANDMKIAFIAATQIERNDHPDTKEATSDSPGVFRCLNPERLLEVVANAKKVSDFVIVYVHWGTESTDEIDWAQKEQAPMLAEAGADLIIGNHPHVLQPIGYCGDIPVIYSLGNFLFNSRAQDTCIVQATLDQEGLKSLQFIPARQENCSVSLHTGAEKERVLSYMREISPGVSVDEEGFITKD